MKKLNLRRQISLGLCALIAGTALGAGAANASDSSCREWRDEHRHWKVVVVRRFLHGAPQRELDEAIFEMLQREAYLTSCDASVQVARAEMVGWRLAGRPIDDYGSVVIESILERAGFDVGLRSLFDVPVRGASRVMASTPGSRKKLTRGYSHRAN